MITVLLFAKRFAETVIERFLRRAMTETPTIVMDAHLHVLFNNIFFARMARLTQHVFHVYHTALIAQETSMIAKFVNQVTFTTLMEVSSAVSIIVLLSLIVFLAL